MAVPETTQVFTIERPQAGPSSFRAALYLAIAFGVLKFGVQTLASVVMQHAGYGIFRDELYFIVCGRNVAWGYVDQPPMVPLLTRMTELAFGIHSLALLRLFTAVAGGLEVMMTGLLVWRLGGARWAQALAMTGIFIAPMSLGNYTISTSVLEPFGWMLVVYAMVELTSLAERGVRSGPLVARWWMVMGVTAGLGLENKWNEFFFLACLLAALVVSPQRKVLASRWFAVGFALIVLMAAPNLLWEVHHHWATLTLLHNDQVDGKNVQLPPLRFVWEQIYVQGILMAPVWIAGIGWLLFGRRAKPFRYLGLLYVLYLPLMMALHAKDYYLAAIYPLYFAAGAAAWDGWLHRAWLRRGLTPAYVALHVVGTAIALPMIWPVMPPAQELAYMARLHLKPPKMEHGTTAALPQMFADMLDWKHKANLLADAYWSLPPEERAQAVIYTKNYGDASAVNVYRPDVPVAISGHQNYFFWGPRGHTGAVMIIFGDSYQTDKSEFDSVKVYARDTNPWVEPYERGPVLVCKGLHGGLQQIWPKVRFWY
jgi:hypothetical protein